MTVWPSLAARPDGRFLGRMYRWNLGFRLLGIPITIGRILALLTAPLVIPLFFITLLPFSAQRYRLTNRRVVVQKGWRGEDERSVSLDRFDNILIEVQPGQAWYHAGDLIFRLGQVETLRLQGVPRPETFRNTCLDAQRSHVGVQKALGTAMA